MASVPGRAALPRRGEARRPWRPAADRVHARIAVAALSGTAILCLASPAAGAWLREWGGSLLLVGGALIGVPHGSSDFVVAHRLMRPACGRLWLLPFLAGYLALVAATMAGWALAPLATLLAFLAVSGLHFGAGDAGGAGEGPDGSPLAFAVRATTPVLPIFLVHPGGVAGIIAALGGTSEAGTAMLLDALRWPLLPVWAAALALVALPGLAAGGRRALDAAEILSIAAAAVVLPPLTAFGLYFCLVHAVRHMLGVAQGRHPARPAAAAALAAGIVVPSALACLVALWFTWDGLAGFLDTGSLVTWSLRVVAALTVPHMALDGWAMRARGGVRFRLPRVAPARWSFLDRRA